MNPLISAQLPLSLLLLSLLNALCLLVVCYFSACRVKGLLMISGQVFKINGDLVASPRLFIVA